MSRHSKNNTAASFFTAAEREQLKYGTQKQRIGRDSLKDYNACFLCLQAARDPLCCSRGHLACKECFYDNILSQKKQIERQRKLLEAHQKELSVEESAKAEAKRMEKVVQFAKTQVEFVPTDEGRSKGEKKSLPSFWVLAFKPTLTPDAKPTTVDAPRESILCTAGDPEHSISLKKLVSIQFSTSKTDNGTQISCPSCLKALRNGMRMIFSKNCGHVVCGTCTDKFVKKSGHCFVCEKRCKEKELVTLQTEGTGLAGGGGKLRAEKVEVAFAG
ncbi:hypothetical protein BJ742DRAFT_87292 [Cladochytrium replicatum]|nr:hypothetical protein BJ742DRAFT_87292 [Cladochytrium replicatum]